MVKAWWDSFKLVKQVYLGAGCDVSSLIQKFKRK